MKAILVSALIFACVFVAGMLLPKLFKKGGSAPQLPVLGTTHALHSATLHSSWSLKDSVLGYAQPQEVLKITGCHTDETGRGWFQIQWQGGVAYCKPADLAPPTGADAAKEVELLRFFIQSLDDGERIPDAAAAVEHYRQLFPNSENEDQLIWTLAEQSRLLAAHSHRRGELLHYAKLSYEEIASWNGPLAEQARRALAEITSSNASHPRAKPKSARNLQ